MDETQQHALCPNLVATDGSVNFNVNITVTVVKSKIMT